MKRILAILLVCLAAAAPPPAASAQGEGAQGEGAQDANAAARMQELRGRLASPDGRRMLELLADPAVGPRLLAGEPAAPAARRPRLSMGTLIADRLAELRSRILGIGASFSATPSALMRTWRTLTARIAAEGGDWLPLYIAVFVGAGQLATWAVMRATRDWRVHFNEVALETPRQRVGVTFERLGFGVLMVTASVAGSLGAFLLFDWPSVSGAVILDYLIVYAAVRLSMVAGRFLFAPGAARMRLVPMSTTRAWFLHHRLMLLTGLIVFGLQTDQILETIDTSIPDRLAIAHATGIVTVLAMLEALIGWQLRETPGIGRRRISVFTVIGVPWVLAIWLTFISGARAPGWTAFVVTVALLLILVVRRAVDTVIYGGGDGQEAADRAYGVVAERGGQALVVSGAALLIGHVWHLDMAALTSADTPGQRVVRGILEVVVILLLSDLAWQLVRVLIDARISGTNRAREGLSEQELRRRARIRTLLPILRNLLFVVLIVLAVMSALSALGFEIAPLLAGAGVVGISVGFGAQTLVRDIIAGIFFLLDDAFRVGEFIESGGISGTVESFSLRSVMVRHTNGQLQTVPFGDLKSITNYSRDWVNQELRIGVPHDTDLDALERIIGIVSDELMSDPEIAALILDPVQSEGVLRISETAIEVGLLVKTPPGKQFRVRRILFDRLKKAFAANGIRFAVPTLRVAGQADAIGVPFSPPG